MLDTDLANRARSRRFPMRNALLILLLGLLAVACTAPAMRDTDGDGVADPLDQCLKTPAGMLVNTVGCPVPVRTEKLDDDGDGVMNTADQCPQTTAGAAVDAVGCEHDDGNNGTAPAEQ